MTAASEYSALERLFFSLAFRMTSVQRMLADIEDTLFAKELNAIEVDRPVFVSSIARAGTTILLECLSSAPEFAFHSYRNMPLVLCPLLWRRISGLFQSDIPDKERAHGDGIKINADSPEAFEECLWKAFWPEKFQSDKIDVWSPDSKNPEFEAFFESHMRKIILSAASTQGEAGQKRYLSKNNANISRIGYLTRMFRDCKILIPIRDPVSHATSLLRQHVKFKKLHEADRFGRRYMEAIGHHEFGAGLKPMDFGSWTAESAHWNPMEIEYWLQYWIAAYRHVSNECESPNVFLVSFEQLCVSPESTLDKVADVLEMRDASALRSSARNIRAQRASSPGLSRDGGLYGTAADIYSYLRSNCI